MIAIVVIYVVIVRNSKDHFHHHFHHSVITNSVGIGVFLVGLMDDSTVSPAFLKTISRILNFNSSCGLGPYVSASRLIVIMRNELQLVKNFTYAGSNGRQTHNYICLYIVYGVQV